METPDKFMKIARARACMEKDRAWAAAEQFQDDISRIAANGPSEGDDLLIQLIASLVSGELHWHQANRQLMEQGVIDKED